MESNFNEQAVAFQMNSLFFKEKQSPGQVAEIYSAWSKTYDKLMNPNTYAGPRMAAEEVSKMVPECRREEVRVLDVSAGTGQVGIELYKRGFTWVEAVEPSSGMLEMLFNTGVYTNAYKEFLGYGDSSIPKAAFDVVVNVGGMGEGHIPVRGIDDMIALTKPGGWVVILMRQEYLDEVDEYRGRLETRMNLLEKSGQWRKVVKKTMPNYFCDKSGIIFVYKVL